MARSSGSESTSGSDSDDLRERPVHPAEDLRTEAVPASGAEPGTAAAPRADLQPSRRQSSDEGEDSDARRRRRRRERKDKGLKVKKSSSSKEKKRKRKHKKDEKERKSRKDKGPVQLSQFLQRGEGSGAKYSAVSGKKIKLKVEKTKADREAERNRKSLLAVLNASYD